MYSAYFTSLKDVDRFDRDAWDSAFRRNAGCSCAENSTSSTTDFICARSEKCPGNKVANLTARSTSGARFLALCDLHTCARSRNHDDIMPSAITIARFRRISITLYTQDILYRIST